MKLTIRKSTLLVASASVLAGIANCDAGLFDRLFHKRNKVEHRLPNADCSFGYHATTWQPWDTCHLTEPCESGCRSQFADESSATPMYTLTPWSPPYETEPQRPTEQPYSSEPMPMHDPFQHPIPQRDGQLRFPDGSTIPRSSVPGLQPGEQHNPTPIPPPDLLIPRDPTSTPGAFQPQRSPSPSGIPQVGRDANRATPGWITLPVPSLSPMPGSHQPQAFPNGQSPQVPAVDPDARYQPPQQIGPWHGRGRLPDQSLQHTSYQESDNRSMWRVMPSYYPAQQAASGQTRNAGNVEFLPPP